MLYYYGYQQPIIRALNKVHYIVLVQLLSVFTNKAKNVELLSSRRKKLNCIALLSSSIYTLRLFELSALNHISVTVRLIRTQLGI